MKQLMFIRVNGHLFWRKKNCPALKGVLNQCRNFALVKTVQEPRNDLTKPELVSKKFENFQLLKRLSSDFQNENALMDFEVWPYPSIFHVLKNLYFFSYGVKKIDPNFSLDEFIASANVALQVVTALLSELQFSELEGLLTPECKKEVEKNIRFWTKNQISSLAFRPEQVWKVSLGESVVFSDEKDVERVFVEIRLIHYVLVRPVNFDVQDFPKSLFNILHNRSSDVIVYGIYNTKFIRQYTVGVSDQWTINAINVKYFLIE